MIQEDKKFLSYFLTEPVYLVKEREPENSGKLAETVEASTITEIPETKKSPTLPIFPYQGKNLKKILLLFEHSGEEKLAQKEEIFLGKILHAVNLNFDDVALLNISLVKPDSFAHLTHFDATVWLSFGVTNNTLPITQATPPYQIFATSGVKYLLADTLEEIEKDKDKKVKLWNNLKKLFTP